MEAGVCVEGQEKNCFTVVYLKGNVAEFVEIHEIDMNGWLLYECRVLPLKKVYYFSWESNARNPEWINLEKEAESDDVILLCEELVKYKMPAA